MTRRCTPINTYAAHLERSCSGDRGGGVAERLAYARVGVPGPATARGPRLAPQRLVGRDQLRRAVLDALVEIVERPLQLVLGAASIGMSSKVRAQRYLAVEVAERHLSSAASGPRPPCSGAVRRCRTAVRRSHHLLVPVDEPVGAELRASAGHVAVGHPDQEAGSTPAKLARPCCSRGTAMEVLQNTAFAIESMRICSIAGLQQARRYRTGRLNRRAYMSRTSAARASATASPPFGHRVMEIVLRTCATTIRTSRR